jgi:PAS domain S-box-containing protein
MALNNGILDYKAVFEVVPGISALLKANSPHYTIIAVTNDFVTRSEIEREKLVGKDFFESFPLQPDFTDFDSKVNLRESFEKVIQNKEPHQLAAHSFQKPGSNYVIEKQYWKVLSRPLLDEFGNVQYIIYSAEEVVNPEKRKEREGNLKTLETTYQLFMQAPVAICILKGPDHTIALANDSILQIWRKGKDVIGKPILEALPEIKGSHFPDLLSNVLTTGRPHYENESNAYFVRNGKEELVYFNFVYQPYYEENIDKPIGVLAIANEITEQVLARKRAEESEQRYRNLIAEADVATAVYMGQEMVIQYANEAMLRLWGKEATVIGKTVSEALPELEGQPFLKQLDNVFTTGNTYWGKEDKGELVVDGKLQTYYFNFSYKALRSSDSQIYGILNMAVDVTEQVETKQKIKESEANLQKRVQERTLELENKNKELERSNANLEEFAYAASHDMKEPIRKIHFFADRLKQHLGNTLDADAQRYFDRLQHAAKRMGTLIDDLLAYSHVSRGASFSEEVNLNKKVKLVLEDLELEVEQKGAKITVDILPVIKGHKRQIQQLFQNLIGNALKYSKPGIAPEIKISCKKVMAQETGLSLRDDHQLFYEINIQDNGIGFDQKDADRIFNVFTRLHGNAEYTGTGIGLSIARKVVENHKGYIMAESTPGEGALFKMYFPIEG